jgi:hypothetical protein
MNSIKKILGIVWCFYISHRILLYRYFWIKTTLYRWFGFRIAIFFVLMPLVVAGLFTFDICYSRKTKYTFKTSCFKKTKPALLSSFAIQSLRKTSSTKKLVLVINSNAYWLNLPIVLLFRTQFSRFSCGLYSHFYALAYFNFTIITNC